MWTFDHFCEVAVFLPLVDVLSFFHVDKTRACWKQQSALWKQVLHRDFQHGGIPLAHDIAMQEKMSFQGVYRELVKEPTPVLPALDHSNLQKTLPLLLRAAMWDVQYVLNVLDVYFCLNMKDKCEAYAKLLIQYLMEYELDVRFCRTLGLYFSKQADKQDTALFCWQVGVRDFADRACFRSLLRFPALSLPEKLDICDYAHKKHISAEFIEYEKALAHQEAGCYSQAVIILNHALIQVNTLLDEGKETYVPRLAILDKLVQWADQSLFPTYFKLLMLEQGNDAPLPWPLVWRYASSLSKEKLVTFLGWLRSRFSLPETQVAPFCECALAMQAWSLLSDLPLPPDVQCLVFFHTGNYVESLHWGLLSGMPFPRTKRYVARAYSRLGDTTKAMALLQELDDNKAVTHLEWALFHAQQGSSELAQKHLRIAQARDQDPRSFDFDSTVREIVDSL